MGVSGANQQEPVAIYRRRMPVSLERMIENALDWEHLPWLHARTFEMIEVVSADQNHWCARSRLVGAPEPTLLELRLHADRLGWGTRTLEGAGAGTLIDSRVVVHAQRDIEVEVAFHVPGLADEAERSAVGAVYAALYEQLYDEDEAMMVGRQRRLDERRRRGGTARELGDIEGLRNRLPLTVATERGRFRIVEMRGRLVVHSAVCPHSLGPLEEPPCEVADGRMEVRCPWHGYRFDLESGASSDGRSLRLARPPALQVDEDGQARLVWPGED